MRMHRGGGSVAGMAAKKTRGTTVRGAATKRTTTKRPGPKAPPSRSPAKRRGGGKKMKAYASFDLWFADRSPKQRRLLTALRELVARAAPGLVESVKWGNGCWLADGAPVAYAYSDTDHVQFGFFRGAFLADPRGLLQGKGQFVRHVKVRELADVDDAALTALLHEAVR